MHTKKSALIFVSIAVISGTLLFDRLSPEKKVNPFSDDLWLTKSSVLEIQNELSISGTENPKIKNEFKEKVSADDLQIAELETKIENDAAYKKDNAWMYLKIRCDDHQNAGKKNRDTLIGSLLFLSKPISLSGTK